MQKFEARTLTTITDTLVQCECGKYLRRRFAHLHKCTTLADARKLAHRRKDYGIRTPKQFEYIARMGE